MSYFPVHAEPLDKVTLQLKWVHAFQFAGYYAAKEQGYYQEVGLDVDIVPAAPETDVVDLVSTGKAEYGVGTSSLILAFHQGRPVSVLAAIFQHSPQVLITKQKSSTQSIHDIINGSIMLERQSDEIIAYLKQEGISTAQLQLHEHSFNPYDLINDNVDVMTAYVTNETYFLHKEGVEYHAYTPRSAGIDFYGDNLFTSTQELKNNPERVKAFKEASLKGWQYAMANPQQTVELILSQYPTSYTQEFLAFEAEKMIPLLQPTLVELGYMSLGRWQHIAQTYVELGMLPANVSLDGFIYTPEKHQNNQWLYRVLAIALTLSVILTYITIHILKHNKKLDYALGESKKAEQTAWNQANLDTLTKLPNSQLFNDRFEQELKQAERQNVKVTMLYIDLDRFKEINTSHDTKTGDQLLQQVAIRLKHCVRGTDTVARLYDDKFAILIGGINQQSDIDKIVNSILQKLHAPFEMSVSTFYLSASIGLAIYPTDGQTINKLLERAEAAKSKAKENGRNQFQYYTATMHKQAMDRIQLNKDLHKALTQQEFTLAYQPILNLNSNEIVSIEALVRWQHPTLGEILPEQFITIAEETDTIIELGDWVFRQAVHQLKIWQTKFNPDLSIHINTSPKQFEQSEQELAAWLDYLKEVDLADDTVVLEVTERLLQKQQSDISERLKQLTNSGLQIALDDFSTSYSSLSYIKHFSLDFIKIDRRFVDKIVSNSQELMLCEIIIVMAHKLGLKVIAEGIETPEQLELLQQSGCDYGQGFLFHKALNENDLTKLFASQKITETPNL
ncbi:EAL domain-containing protein [Psychrobium sp. 1_MG-2023]|uniref:EAL domain-containing protein n=1 Tax=Psychrobium sp. 1_MG-2023 TaxID=3062624 RepID=UPI00273391F3|nr:EAL domain-containing protein [Psychrobium sp. 1_MG-2023]MDP2560656.1 EAL domain-containing protein [Psychrobium sp. 1_MG-2023]